MSAQISTPALNPSPAATFKPSMAAWIGSLSVATLFPLLSLTAAMLAWRRLAGALSEPLDVLLLVLTAAILAAASLTIRALFHGSRSGSFLAGIWPATLILLGPTAAVTAAGLSLSLPGTTPTGLALLWGVLAAGEIAGLVLVRFAAMFKRSTFHAWKKAGRIPRAFKSTASSAVTERHIRIDAPHETVNPVLEQPQAQTEAETALDEATLDTAPQRSVTQQVTREQTPDGAETMTGWLRANFQPGQRTTSVHLAFCPAFAGMPSVEVEQIDGPSARIKTVQLLPYGARFDLKLLNDAEEPVDVLLQFSARG